MPKQTVEASSDLALIKYWGKKDEKLRLPENGSISIILNGLDTVTTVEFQEDLASDAVVIQGESDAKEVARVIRHLDRIRQLAGISLYARVESQNTFPKGTGLSSSGSGFAALTIAATKALDLELSQKDLSILARQGSGTACRCVCSGFIEWLDGDTSETSYSHTIYSADHMNIQDVIAVVSEDKKRVSSTEGHESARSSVFYEARLAHVREKIDRIKAALEAKDFPMIGEIVEAEALEFHSILLTSAPSLIALYPGSLQVMLEVQQLRRENIPAYFSINTGFNVHVLTLPEYVDVVQTRLGQLDLVKKTLKAEVGEGPRNIEEHLF